MSHFYGTVDGNRGVGTRCGTKGSGMEVIAASWDGCIRTYTWYDEEDDVNKYEVYQAKWHGQGINKLLSTGILGE
jgi:hypothetical protein